MNSGHTCLLINLLTLNAASAFCLPARNAFIKDRPASQNKTPQMALVKTPETSTSLLNVDD